MKNRQMPLPLRIHSSPTEFKNKLELIRHCNVLNKKDTLLFHKALSPKHRTESWRSELLRAVKTVEINEFDKAELMLCYLYERKALSDKKILKMFDPSWEKRKILFPESYIQTSQAALEQSAQEVGSMAIPRIRAKLCVLELVAWATLDTDLLANLVKISLRYLKCEVVNNKLVTLRATRNSSKTSEREFTKMTNAIGGLPVPKSRLYSYWKIDFFYNELVASLKLSKTIKKEKERLKYLNLIVKIWNIPSEHSNLLFSGSKSPSQTILDLMTLKKMIESPSTYRNVIAPKVKKIKSSYPFLRACDPAVENLLDFPTKYPEFFIKHDVWKVLEDFSVTDTFGTEIQTNHHISYPTTAIMV